MPICRLWMAEQVLILISRSASRMTEFGRQVWTLDNIIFLEGETNLLAVTVMSLTVILPPVLMNASTVFSESR